VRGGGGLPRRYESGSTTIADYAARGRRILRALAAVNEFPATSLLAVVALALWWKSPAVDACGVRTGGAGGGRRVFLHQLDRTPQSESALLARSGTDNWYTTNSSVTQGRRKAIGARLRGSIARAFPRRLRPARPGGPPRHLFADAGVAAVDRRHDRLDVAGPRPTAPLAGRGRSRHLLGVSGLLSRPVAENRN